MLSQLFMGKKTLVFLILCFGFIAWHFRYSISVTSGLKYPDSPRLLFLKEQKTITTKKEQELTDQTEFFGLGSGVYTEVLTNKHGAFFLAPSLGFFKTAQPTNGFTVGGVYFPENMDEIAFVWELLLKNENRSFSSPSTARTLSETEEQPERALFLDKTWYANKEFSILGRPVIHKDLVIERSLFQETQQAPPLKDQP